MRARRGFTLLEAAVAVAIVGMISVGALAAFSADLRAAQRSQEVLPASALAEERLAALELAEPTRLAMLPDSLKRGRFAPPFERYEWMATASPVRGERYLYDFTVRVQWDSGGAAFTLARRRFRPPPVGMVTR
jgi:prepilin-type N-terminal cleavage/methylation domain-containing protein